MLLPKHPDLRAHTLVSSSNTDKRTSAGFLASYGTRVPQGTDVQDDFLPCLVFRSKLWVFLHCPPLTSTCCGTKGIQIQTLVSPLKHIYDTEQTRNESRVEAALTDCSTELVRRASVIHPAPARSKSVGLGQFCWVMVGNGKSDKRLRQMKVSGTAAS